MSNWTKVTLYPVTATPSYIRVANGDHFINVDLATGNASLYNQGMHLGDFATRQIAEVIGESHIRDIAAFAADEEYMADWAESPAHGTSQWDRGRVNIWRSNGNMLSYPGDTRAYLTSVTLVTQDEAKGTKLAKEGGITRMAGRHETLEQAKAAAGVLPVREWVAQAHVDYKVKARKA